MNRVSSVHVRVHMCTYMYMFVTCTTCTCTCRCRSIAPKTPPSSLGAQLIHLHLALPPQASEVGMVTVLRLPQQLLGTLLSGVHLVLVLLQSGKEGGRGREGGREGGGEEEREGGREVERERGRDGG